MEFVREFVALCCGRERVLRPDGSTEFLPPVQLLTGSGDVAAQARASGRGLEETAREMRYAFLQEAARQAGAQFIATAHTANDNGETLLLHLARGTGLRGLCGIAPKYGNVIRPLLTTSREEIEGYLRFWGLPWREDPSNREDVYARNRLRHRVLPELEALYPGALSRLTDTAQRLRADEEYLTAQAEEALSRLQMGSDGSLTLPAADLGDLPQPLAVRAARALLARMNQGDDRCTAAHLEALAEVCRSGDPSAQIDLPGGLTARREYQLLVLSREQPAPLSPAPPPSARPAPAGGLDHHLPAGALLRAASAPPGFLLGPEGRSRPHRPPPADGRPAGPPGAAGAASEKMVYRREDPPASPGPAPRF